MMLPSLAPDEPLPNTGAVADKERYNVAESNDTPAQPLDLQLLSLDVA